MGSTTCKTRRCESARAGTGRQAFFQAKLSINQENDVYEQEADHVADNVMRMGDNPINQKSFFKPSAIQRKPGAESNGNETGGNTLDSYVSTLSSSGQLMPESSRKFFEPRFGHDFSGVRIHTDSVAAKSAQSVNALAYTSGNNIVFNSGQYSPESDNGKKLMAHELTHVVQQNSSSSGVQRQIQRKLTVNPTDVVPMPAGVTGTTIPLTMKVQGLINDLCPSGGFNVDTTTGIVTGDDRFCTWHPPLVEGLTEADISATPAGCKCLCEVVNNAQTTTVGFSPGGPGTGPRSQPNATAPGQGGTKTTATVNIDPNFQGQYRINGNWVDVPFYLLFSHELCGHALPKMQGTHVPRGAGPAGGTPPQEVHAVDVERTIAAEHGEPRRPDDYSGDARQKP